MRPLILASMSPARRRLLARLGIPFQAVAPRYAEERGGGGGAEALVERHARGKAQSVAAAHPQALIIGSDQIAEIDGELLGKPGTRAGALAQLGRLQGREHRLWTAVALLDAECGALRRHVERTALVLRPLTRKQIEAYLDREEVLGSAGSYRIEGLGIALFERLAGDDPTAVMGLPLIALTRLLRTAGVEALSGG